MMTRPEKRCGTREGTNAKQRNGGAVLKSETRNSWMSRSDVAVLPLVGFVLAVSGSHVAHDTLPNFRESYDDIPLMPIDDNIEDLLVIERDIIIHGGQLFAASIQNSRPDNPLSGDMVLYDSTQFSARVECVKATMQSVITSHGGGLFKAVQSSLENALVASKEQRPAKKHRVDVQG